jgi:hypothetical protein
VNPPGTTVAGVEVVETTEGVGFVFIGRYDTPGAVIAPDVLPSHLIWLGIVVLRADFIIIVPVLNDPILIWCEKKNKHTNSGAQIHRASARKPLVGHRTNHPQEEYEPRNANYEPSPPVPHILTVTLRATKSPTRHLSVLYLCTALRAIIFEFLEGHARRLTTKLSDRRRKRPVGCNSREQIN